jgi:hypothetical protein
MTHKARLKKLEAIQPNQVRPLWAELSDDGRAILRYQDGARVEANTVPEGTKVYQGVSPDDWDKEQVKP